MSRLTIDKLYGEITVLATYCATANVDYLSSIECANRFKSILETIKQYKDIEKELGIDLITLIKALANGIYDKANNRDVRVDLIYHYHLQKRVLWYESETDPYYNGCYLFEDYGKTWALTKEELE